MRKSDLLGVCTLFSPKSIVRCFTFSRKTNIFLPPRIHLRVNSNILENRCQIFKEANKCFSFYDVHDLKTLEKILKNFRFVLFQFNVQVKDESEFKQNRIFQDNKFSKTAALLVRRIVVLDFVEGIAIPFNNGAIR